MHENKILQTRVVQADDRQLNIHLVRCAYGDDWRKPVRRLVVVVRDSRHPDKVLSNGVPWSAEEEAYLTNLVGNGSLSDLLPPESAWK